MKKYQSHKIVEAAQIDHIEKRDDGLPVAFVRVGDVLEDIALPDNFSGRGMPGENDYLVRYDGGYLSWSPKAVFEAGYARIEDKASTWQDRCKIELDELAERIEKLRSFLNTFSGPEIDDQIQAHMQAQYTGMVAYHDALLARLRLTGVVEGEVPTLARQDRGTPAAVEVTVTAPPGKRAEVCMDRVATTIAWTVVGGQSQTWSLMAGETIAVSTGEPHSTVAHKRDNG